MEPTKLNLYQKIHAVMQDVTYLQKDDKISFGNTNYKAISEEKVTSTVRESLLKNGLVIIPIEQEHHKEGNLTTVNVKYKIVDIESGEYEIAMSSGTGADTQDKGVGKAMTYAYKYLLLRTFAIPTGEDPDKTSSAELDAKQNNQQQSKPQNVASEKTLYLVNKLIKEVAQAMNITEAAAVGTLKQRMKSAKDINQYTQTEASKAIEILNKAKEVVA
jgi:ERF superfamily